MDQMHKGIKIRLYNSNWWNKILVQPPRIKPVQEYSLENFYSMCILPSRLSIVFNFNNTSEEWFDIWFEDFYWGEEAEQSLLEYIMLLDKYTFIDEYLLYVIKQVHQEREYLCWFNFKNQKEKINYGS